jgi:predicted O-methyltransferase YrrM
MMHKREYKGIHASQADGWIEAFDEFFKEERFAIVIELGTWCGGMALMLGEKANAKVYTFDVTSNVSAVAKSALDRAGVEVRVENIFETSTVKNLISGQGRVLLLCDNGDKRREVKLFAPFLKDGDVIMAHDYFENAGAYERERLVWKSHEISESDMSGKGLEPYQPYYDLFKKVFWGCGIKRG